MKYLSGLIIFGVLLFMGCGDDDCEPASPSLDNYISERIESSRTVQTYSQDGIEFKYIIDEAGDQNLRPVTSDSVRVTYTGLLTDGTVFESNTATLPLGRTIGGWQLGLPLIGEGGKLTLFLPPNLAYGNRQAGDICPNSSLIFDVELLEVIR